MSEAVPPADKPCHEHSFAFLRQERTNVGYDRNPTWLLEDVFFCSGCLSYARKPIREVKPDGFGQEFTSKTYREGEPAIEVKK